MDLKAKIEFINEIDKLKTVLRVNLLSDASRRENTAEHSWHLGMMVLVLSEHTRQNVKIDLLKASKMALIHDIVEIDAGDTYCYDDQGHHDKYERELKCAERIFGLLPQSLGRELLDLWKEFETAESEEARYVRAIDRLNPFMQNFLSGGLTWKENNITRSQVMKRMGEIEENCPDLWPVFIDYLDKSIEQGWIKCDS